MHICMHALPSRMLLPLGADVLTENHDGVDHVEPVGLLPHHAWWRVDRRGKAGRELWRGGGMSWHVMIYYIMICYILC